MNHPYTLRVQGLPDAGLTVHSMRGTEAMSGLYAFDLVVTTSLLDGRFDQLALGRRCILTFRHGVRERTFHGILGRIRAVGLRGREGHDEAAYRVRLVPRAWLLKQRKDSRIFQHKRVDEVVAEVLAGFHCRASFRLRHDYPVRDYCTQYEETDWAFVTRILAEAGIFFWFEQPPPLDEAAEAVFDGLGGPLGSATGAFGDAATSALGAATSALGAAAGPVAGIAADALRSGVLPGEVMVFADEAGAYLASGEDTSSLFHVASGLMAQAASGLTSLTSTAGPLGGLGGVVAGLGSEVLSALTSAESPVFHHREAGALRGSSEGSIAELSLERRIRATSAVYREFDPSRPMAPITAETPRLGPLGAAGDMARRAASGIGAPAGGPLGAGLDALGAVTRAVPGELGALAGSVLSPDEVDPWEIERYEHHGDFHFPDWASARDEAGRMLRAARRDVRSARGRSFCPTLAVGRRFRLEGHPLSHLDREYVVVELRHRGYADPRGDDGSRERAVYDNEFVCVLAETPFPPPRRAKRRVHTCTTAIVVGAAGEEIHVDAAGRIKVRFHWDRGGANDDTASCWIRSMQSWAGAAFGAQFIPRVGTEVVVGFDGGDPDKPIVLGCVYNGASPTPFNLPADKTRSGLRTRSTPGGRGANELSFRDAAGEEQVLLRAERNLDVHVGANRRHDVRGDDHTTVGGRETRDVGGDVSLVVHGGREVTVEGTDTSRSNGHVTSVIEGNVDQRVAGDRTVRIGRSDTRVTEGSTSVTLHGDQTVRVHGTSVTQVGRHETPRAYVLHVEGTSTHTSTGALEIASDEAIVLRCGESMLRITPQSLQILAESVALQGEGARIRLVERDVRVHAEANVRVVAEEVALRSSGASVGLTSEARMDGSRVLLNSPTSASDPVSDDPSQPTRIVLIDDEGEPMAGRRFRLELEDGGELAGFLNDDGEAEVHLTCGAKIFFPELGGVQHA